MKDAWEEQGRVAAAEARERLGLGSIRPVSIFSVLEDQVGAFLLFHPMEGDFSGVFIRHGKEEAVLINTARTLGHQHFTAAHELYHLLYDPGLTGSICNAGQKSSIAAEKKADWFATHFLMPEEGVKWYARKLAGSKPLTLVDVIDLEQHFAVSHAAMLIRLFTLKLISREDRENWETVSIIKEARRAGFTDQECRLYLPTMEERVSPIYQRLAVRAYEKSRISERKLRELLGEANIDLSFLGQEPGPGGEDAYDFYA